MNIFKYYVQKKVGSKLFIDPKLMLKICVIVKSREDLRTLFNQLSNIAIPVYVNDFYVYDIEAHEIWDYHEESTCVLLKGHRAEVRNVSEFLYDEETTVLIFKEDFQKLTGGYVENLMKTLNLVKEGHIL